MLNQYHIKPGDTLSAIAKKYGVTVDDIMLANPKIKNKDLIYAGDWKFLGTYKGFVSNKITHQAWV
jgi:LysM repeat protein